jgi:hypothetical protein
VSISRIYITCFQISNNICPSLIYRGGLRGGPRAPHIEGPSHKKGKREEKKRKEKERKKKRKGGKKKKEKRRKEDINTGPSP